MKDFLHKAPFTHLITFSGAHSTGKSTLITDLKENLEQHGCNVKVVPSCSSEWARRRSITDYSDINRLGLRKEMQGDLPYILQDFILKAAGIGEQKDSDLFILCDRWFGDIRTYSKLELGESFHDVDCHLFKAQKEVKEQLIEHCFYLGYSLAFTHVFVPVTSCKHLLQVGEVGSKFRATMSHQTWEDAYNEVGSEYTPPDRTQVISSSDRHGRVEEIVGRIRRLHSF